MREDIPAGWRVGLMLAGLATPLLLWVILSQGSSGNLIVLGSVFFNLLMISLGTSRAACPRRSSAPPTPWAPGA